MENLLGPRDANGIPVPLTVEESIASMKASLLKKIKRSAYVYRVDCGGCNGCEIEIFATLSPLFDAERFGIKVVPSRATRISCCSPARSPARCARLRYAHGSLHRIRKSASPTVPAATAAASSTIFTASGAVPTKSCRWTSTFRAARRRPPPRCTVLPWRSACWSRRSTPASRELDNQPATILHPDMVQPLRVKIDRTARRLAGYRYGRQIADDYLRLLSRGDHQVARWLEAENDPRLNEIVANLNNIVDEARIR